MNCINKTILFEQATNTSLINVPKAIWFTKQHIKCTFAMNSVNDFVIVITGGEPTMHTEVSDPFY